MGLIDVNKIPYLHLDLENKVRFDDVNIAFKDDIDNMLTVKAIPIEVFYKMIHNALADTKKENWEPEECPYDYFDGNRNAIHCMLDILCGDKDGDHDTFWNNYQKWEKENEKG